MLYISPEEIETIHGALVDYFAQQSDPISPAGIKSRALLESAIFRQQCGYSGKDKYSDIHENAATLLFGICMDHPFHNGNKRTALVATLVHLEKNHRIPNKVSHSDFYDLVVNLANHTVQDFCKVETRSIMGEKRNPSIKISPDDEVKIIGKWLKNRTRPIRLGEHPKTFRQLRKILSRFECSFGTPNQNFIEITRTVEETFSTWYFIPKRRNVTLKTHLSYAGDGETVGIDTIKKIRRDLNLSINDGVDSENFYETQENVDRLLFQYHGLLKKLARI